MDMSGADQFEDDVRATPTHTVYAVFFMVQCDSLRFRGCVCVGALRECDPPSVGRLLNL